MTLITVVIVAWNSADTLRLCLDSVIEQQGDFETDVILVDNGSSDNSLEIAESYPRVKVIRNETNLGFCRANNQGITQAEADYVLLLNPDARLGKDYLRTLLGTVQESPEAALATGKVYLMRGDGQAICQDGLPVFDSVGIELKRDRQAVDIGRGEPDQGQYDQTRQVFGVSGAVCLCRRQALREAMVDDQVFDNLFFAYKEDVDLSWRLGLFGWKCLYVPGAIAYHARGWRPGISRDEIPRPTRYHSFVNRRLAILKNDTWRTWLPDLIPILWFEALSLGYAVTREPFLLKGYWAIITQLPRIKRWRQAIHRKRRPSISDRDRWTGRS